MSVERDAGVAAFGQGDIATAITQLEAATRQDPQDFQAHLYLGAAYGQADRQMDAVTTLTQAVTIEPANPKARYNLGVAMEKAGYKEQAIAVLQQALMLQPDYAKAQEALQRLTGAPAPQTAVVSAPPTQYGATAAPAQPAPYGTQQMSASSATTSPLPTDRPWPGQQSQTPATAYPTQAMQSTPQPGAQTAYPAATTQPYQQQGVASYGGPPTTAYGQQQYGAYPQPYGMAAMQNTSGMKGDVPAEVLAMNWNWGAFYFGWVWLCAHNMVGAGLGLFFGSLVLGFIPFVNLLSWLVVLGVAIYLGMNGSKLGWQNRRFDSVEHFRTVQRIWAKWALGFFIASIVIGILFAVLIFFVMGMQGASNFQARPY